MKVRRLGRWPYSSTPAAYIRIAAEATTATNVTSRTRERISSHSGTDPVITRASIANGLNGGMSEASLDRVPPPPLSRIGNAVR